MYSVNLEVTIHKVEKYLMGKIFFINLWLSFFTPLQSILRKKMTESPVLCGGRGRLQIGRIVDS